MKKITFKTNIFTNTYPTEISFVTTGEICYKFNEKPYIELPIDACPLEIEFYKKLVLLGYLEESNSTNKFYISDTIKQISGREATTSEELEVLKMYPKVHLGEYIKILQKYCNADPDYVVLCSDSNHHNIGKEYLLIRYILGDKLKIYHGKDNYTYVIDESYSANKAVLSVYEKSSYLNTKREVIGLVVNKKYLPMLKDYIEFYC